MGCGNSSPVTPDLVPSGTKDYTVNIFKKRTMAGLQHHAEDLIMPKDNQKMKHEILGTCNSDSVSNIDIIVMDWKKYVQPLTLKDSQNNFVWLQEGYNVL